MKFNWNVLNLVLALIWLLEFVLYVFTDYQPTSFGIGLSFFMAFTAFTELYLIKRKK